ncbi:MAG TPA: hypothetical protein VFJ91_00640 [Gaiellaceae bacterium]|nr:hypothetical protein [Gaiellaceae bacterium]
MSAEPESLRVPGRARPAEVVSGYLSAIAIFAGLVGIAWHPLRLTPLAMLLALLAAAMSGRGRTLPLAGVAIAAACFFLGMAVAVVTSHPLW